MKSERKARLLVDISQAPFSIEAKPSEAGRNRENSARIVGDDIRILLADDHPILRKGVLASLSDHSRMIVVAEAINGLDAIQKATELSPDLILMDIDMPEMDGLAATEVLSKKFPEIKVLILSMHSKPEYIIQAIQKGARGFVLKGSSPDELIRAIEIVQRGEPFFSGDALAPTTDHGSRKDHEKDPSELFEREKEVLVHLASGLGNKEIAELLDLSVRTVESHRARLMKKLKIHTIAGLTQYAMIHGLISLSSFFPMSAITNRASRFPPAPGSRI